MAESKTETPNTQSSLEQWNNTRWERWKYIVRGSFLGLCAGAIFSLVVPKDLIRQNKFLNHWIQPDNMAPNLYPASNSAVFAWIGVIIGGIADIVRAWRRPSITEELTTGEHTVLRFLHDKEVSHHEPATPANRLNPENKKDDSFVKQCEQEKAAKSTSPSTLPLP